VIGGSVSGATVVGTGGWAPASDTDMENTMATTAA
jgi:hypothetical protein